MANRRELPERRAEKVTPIIQGSASAQLLIPRKTVSLAAIRTWPRSRGEQEEYSRAMSERLLSLFVQQTRLSDVDREAFLAGNLPEDTRKQFDEFIIQQAGVYGWRIRVNRIIAARTAHWYESGKIELVRRFDEAIIHRALIARGEAKGSITDPAWYVARPDAVQELRTLLRQRLSPKLTRVTPSLSSKKM